jgi:hypothetical protein
MQASVLERLAQLLETSEKNDMYMANGSFPPGTLINIPQ